MAINMTALINQELAKLEQRDYGKSTDPMLDTLISGWQTGLAMKEANRKEAIYKDVELDGIGTSLDSLVSAIDNVDSLGTAEAQLALYEKEAGSNAEHRINALTLRENINRKREAFGDYGNAIQEASDAFDRGEMSFKQADYENLPETFTSINAKRKAEGLKEHGSIMDYMSSELTRTQRLIEGVSPGIVQNPDGSARAQFRYGKANNSDIATYNQLTKHAGNIEIAMKALAGDGIITPEEAEAIMVNPANYEAVKTAAAGEAKSQLGAYQSKYNWWLDSMNKLEQDKFAFDESDAMMMSIYEDLSGVDQQALKSGNIDKQKKVMADQRDKYFKDMIFQDDKHFQWTGRHLIPRESDDFGDTDFGKYDDKVDAVDDSDQVSADITAPEPTQVDSTDYGVFQINDKTFANYNPADMSQEEQIQFASKIVNNELSDPTVGSWNKNDGWNNWSVYKNETADFKLARGKSDDWLVKNGLSQQQLDSIDENFKTNKDKKIARAVMYAESKGDHTAKYENKTAALGAKLSPEEFAKLSPGEQAKFTTSVKKPVKTIEEKKEAVTALKKDLSTQKESLDADRDKVVSYGTIFRNANVGFKKMLKNKKTTDKFKTKKGNLKKRLAKAKDRLASLEFEEIRPQTDIEAAIDFLNPADQMRLSSVKSEIARLESQLGSYNRFEEFLKTYGDAESEWKRIRKEINSYYK